MLKDRTNVLRFRFLTFPLFREHRPPEYNIKGDTLNGSLN